jgi:beta-lactam-binding protein with PASTA domain
MTQPTDHSENAFKKFQKRHPILSTILLAIVAIYIFLFVAFKFLDIWTHHGATSIVPDVKGLTYDKACDVLEEADLKVVISDSIYDDSKVPGSVVEVWPKPGATVKTGREVYLTIISFSPRQVVIDIPLTDISSRQAISYLKNRGINSIQILRVPSEYPDMVVAVKANGQYVTLGSRIPTNSTVILEVGQVEEETYTSPESDLDSVIDSLMTADKSYDEEEPETDPIYE